MAAPGERDWITFTVDGREVRAPENEWLVDAVKRGDVEVPYFCYEPKLGNPVGACRMCLVEIEGIPKLQTSCSTPVKDGMVVHTQTDRVKEAQNAVVEFLLVNHPLDCPVCDKGGECPLQDISYGWGRGRSRTVDIKRNFPKPIALSPLIAIDRERCILCYRCVRFSQEVAEDYQLTFLERGDHTFVGTFDGRPYEAPFSGNIVELCPVGALTSTAYRFRARPWDIVDSGSVCTLCPSQCNVAFTVRDDRVERVLARDNAGVDDGWLCDKGRWGYQAINSEERILAPLVRDGGFLRPASWERALEAAVDGLGRAGSASAAIVGGGATNEEGHLIARILREALGSGSVDSRAGGTLEAETARMLSHPGLAASVPDIDSASVVLTLETDPVDEAPIIDLRLRKAVRRSGARLIVASSRPTALDGGAAERLAFAPGTGEALLRGLQKALLEIEDAASAPEAGAKRSGEQAPQTPPPDGAGDKEAGREAPTGHEQLASFLAEHPIEWLAELAGVAVPDLRDAAALLTGAENVVVVWGERLGWGERGPGALRALRDLALLLGLDAADGSGLIEIPAQPNGRGLREVGCLSNMGPGLSDLVSDLVADLPSDPASGAQPGLSAAEARDRAASGELKAIYLLGADPLREHPGRESWEQALGSAFVVAHEQFLTESVERHADVVFPAESNAEKEGTVTHPDGRVQRVRPAVGHPGEVRMEWQVLVELGTRLGLDLEGHVTAGAILSEIAERVPLYRGLTLDEIGGRGVRWQEREESRAAAAEVLGDLEFGEPTEPLGAPPAGDGLLRLATRPDIWGSWVTGRAPSLGYLEPEQELILNPIDADALGLRTGDPAEVASGAAAVTAMVRVREGTKRGTAVLIEGTTAGNATVLFDRAPVMVEVRGQVAGGRGQGAGGSSESSDVRGQRSAAGSPAGGEG
jgi:NADH-quinone oxidoreductase subunit G